jgi:hypothetical protein
MTTRGTWPAAVCLAWAALGGSVAAVGFGTVNADARLLVLSATVVGVAAAVAAAGFLARGRPRPVGLCLVVSVVTPTWAAAAVNLLPLAAGILLLALAPSARAPAGTRCRPTGPSGRSPHRWVDRRTRARWS